HLHAGGHLQCAAGAARARAPRRDRVLAPPARCAGGAGSHAVRPPRRGGVRLAPTPRTLEGGAARRAQRGCYTRGFHLEPRMATSPDTSNLAVFCDFENIALGVRDARYPQLDIRLVIERLLLKGSIVVRKAYCDWDRYKDFKAGMHQAGFELIEIPHVKQSGKNSADIRMVVDALDLCYTKPHVETFVIVSGDSDFSPLVAKLRENNKGVIGVGVKNSTSDLLTASCDEFIYYDDLVRAVKTRPAKRGKKTSSAARTPSAEAPAESTTSESKEHDKHQEAFD